MRTFRLLPVFAVFFASGLQLSLADRGGDRLDKLPRYTGIKRRIAVTEIEMKLGTSTVDASAPNGASVQPPVDFGEGLTEMLVTALSESNRFVLLERSDKALQDIQKEQMQGGVSEETRLQANSLMGAEVIVRGAVTEFSATQGKTDSKGIIPGVDISQNRSSAKISIDLRIYDVSTGEVVEAERATGEASAKGLDLNLTRNDLNLDSSSFKSSTLGKATRKAIENAVFVICTKLDKRPWQARIADVIDDESDAKQLYLNVGSQEGIKVGDEFEVFHPGKTIMDPDNPGRILATSNGKRIGRCRVSSVQPNVAIATPIEGDGFAAKDVIRLPEPQPKGRTKG